MREGRSSRRNGHFCWAPLLKKLASPAPKSLILQVQAWATLLKRCFASLQELGSSTIPWATLLNSVGAFSPNLSIFQHFAWATLLKKRHLRTQIAVANDTGWATLLKKRPKVICNWVVFFLSPWAPLLKKGRSVALSSLDKQILPRSKKTPTSSRHHLSCCFHSSIYAPESLQARPLCLFSLCRPLPSLLGGHVLLLNLMHSNERAPLLKLPRQIPLLDQPPGVHLYFTTRAPLFKKWVPLFKDSGQL